MSVTPVTFSPLSPCVCVCVCVFVYCCFSIKHNHVAQSMLVHRYQAQLNRFTTLSSPGSQDLPPGLPPYVNPHIEHSENMTQDIFYISAGQAGHLVLLIILAVVGGVSSVGLRDTECKPSPIFMAPLKIICSCSTRVISLFLLVEGNT